MMTFRHGIPLRKIDLPFRFVNPRVVGITGGFS